MFGPLFERAPPGVVWAGLTVMVAAWGAVAMLIVRMRSATARGRTAGRLAGAVAAAIVASIVFRGLVVPRVPTGRELGVSAFEPVPDVTILTDGGTSIPAERLADPVADGVVPRGFEGRVIVADTERALSNCHGWVFTGGLYCIPGASVDAILRDNGYRKVGRPRPQDLIVYRDGHGKPVHTGVVKAVGRDRFVLVESKWGQLDVFWHTPEDQGYSESFDYWRSDRDGHLLDVSTRAADSVGRRRG